MMGYLWIAGAVVAAAAAAAWGAQRIARAPLRALVADLRRLDVLDPDHRLEPQAYRGEAGQVAEVLNRLLVARRLADLAARDATARAKAGDGRAEQVARELHPSLEVMQRTTEGLREGAADPVARAALDELVRQLAHTSDLVRGVLAVADAAAQPHAAGDLSEALRRMTRRAREQLLSRRAEVLLDLDERACLVPGTTESLDRLAWALLQHGAKAGGDAARLGVYVRRVPRRRLEEGQVRRATDPALTIVPRRPNPRLERWLRESRPPAEVVKLVVACSGHGIPGDIDKQLYDPSHPGGLGLAIARRIVEQARGALWIQRAREGGTSFHIVLPFAAPSLLPDHEADDARLLAAS